MGKKQPGVIQMSVKTQLIWDYGDLEESLKQVLSQDLLSLYMIDRLIDDLKRSQTVSIALVIITNR